MCYGFDLYLNLQKVPKLLSSFNCRMITLRLIKFKDYRSNNQNTLRNRNMKQNLKSWFTVHIFFFSMFCFVLSWVSIYDIRNESGNKRSFLFKRTICLMWPQVWYWKYRKKNCSWVHCLNLLCSEFRNSSYAALPCYHKLIKFSL